MIGPYMKLAQKWREYQETVPKVALQQSAHRNPQTGRTRDFKIDPHLLLERVISRGWLSNSLMWKVCVLSNFRDLLFFPHEIWSAVSLN